MYSKVYVEITNICNMNCSFCHGHGREAGAMTREQFCAVLDKLEGHTKYIYYHLMGEPLMHPLLQEFIRIASGKGFLSVITTNGTLLVERGEELIESGVYKVNISLHSFENDDETGFLKYMGQVADFAEKASQAGIIVVMRLWNKGFDDGRADLALEFLRNHISGEWEENTRGLRIHHKLHLEWGDRFEWPDMEAPLYGEEVYCYGLRDHFGILCDGRVVPCCLDSDGLLELGNIFENSIDEIVNAPRGCAIREGFEGRHAAEELCRRCGYAQRFVT
ncbi:MAG: radical SAM protein [Firmicutes bacterium]|nr:radical SAM protein [Bacillota bacterium]